MPPVYLILPFSQAQCTNGDTMETETFNIANFSGQIVGSGALLIAVGALYKKLGELINQNYAMNREHNQMLVGVIQDNTKAMERVAVVVSNCEK